MFKPHYILGALLLVFFAVVLLDVSPIACRRIQEYTNYGPSVQVRPIEIADSQFLDIIRERVACLEKTPLSPSTCEPPYRLHIEALVSGENRLVSDASLFWGAVLKCPHQYDECITRQGAVRERCIGEEGLCLASASRNYWKAVVIHND